MLEEDNNFSDPETADAARTGAPLPPKRRRRGLDRMTVGVGLLVLLGAGGLYYMHARTAAAVAMVGQADEQAARVEAMLAGGREGLSALTRDMETTRATIDRFTKRDMAALAVARSDERDPFSFRSIETDDSASLGMTNNASRDAAKAQALAAAQRLQLQSIMYGTSRRSCLVDGKLYFEGQSLGEFTVSRISSDAVILQSGEFKFQLRLRK